MESTQQSEGDGKEMNEEITPEQIRQVLDLELDDYHGHRTVRAYLLALLRDVWNDLEGFDGKRPFGNSSWDYDIKVPMLKAGIIGGQLDRDGDVVDLDDEEADRLILAAIAALDASREADAEPQPAKVIIVTEAPAGDRAPVERHYAAVQWEDSEPGRLRLFRAGHLVASYGTGTWLSVREDGATVPDGTATALGIARRALEEISKTVLEADDPRREVVRVACDAAEEIFTETEL